MSSVMIDDTNDSSAFVESETPVHKLQELVQNHPVRNCKQPTFGDENLPLAVDANANSNVSQCTDAGRSDVVRSQRLNLKNSGITADVHDNSISSTADTIVSNSTASANLSLDTVDLIDIDDIPLDDEENWLYRSPTKVTGSWSCPRDWLRADFDSPGPDVYTARRSLLQKLNQLMQSPASEPPKPASHRFDMMRAIADKEAVDRGDFTDIIKVSPGTTRNTPGLSSASNNFLRTGDGHSSSPKALTARRASATDTQYVLSPVKTDSLKTAVDISKSSEQIDGLKSIDKVVPNISGVNSSSVGNLDAAVKRTSASEENLLGSGYRLSDVTDIKQLARQQEESLRLSYNAPLVMSKKGLSKSLNRSSGALVVDESHDPSPLVLTNTLNRSSGSLQQAIKATSTVTNTAANPVKLSDTARQTSRSAGNLINSHRESTSRTPSNRGRVLSSSGDSGTVSQKSATSVTPRPSHSTSSPSVSSAVAASGTNASGLRTPRSSLRTSKLTQPSKPEPRSTSLHTPRTITNKSGGVALKNGLSLPKRGSTNSLPSSPRTSDQSPDRPMRSSGDGVRQSVQSSTVHRQSLPNLSRSSKLTLPSSSSATSMARRGSAQTTTVPSSSTAKSTSPVKQPARAPTPRNALQKQPISPTRTARSAGLSEPSPSLSVTGRVSNGSLKQPSKLSTPNRSRLPSPGTRRTQVSTVSTSMTSKSADDSWKDGCF